ncbi:DUF4974 domain-containing protein [Marinilabiliaceae bacterium JC017]|nr:DUF4974 domain-containing protein [Marinilabiliaceae bacterium JC017]
MREIDQKYKLLARELARESNQSESLELQAQEQEDAKLKQQHMVLKEFWNRFFPVKSVASKQKILSDVMIRALGEKPLKRPRMTRWYGAVGVLVVALAISLFWGVYQANKGVELMHYQANVGEIKHIVLPDGSEVNLNAASSLIVPQQFKGDERQVILMGEGYFKVARDETKAFVISTTHMDVTVLGTQFNLKAYANDQEIRTFLDKGKIQLTGNFKNRDKVVLIPGQEAILNKADGQLSVIDRPGHQSGLWQEGKLIFHNNTLAEIARVLERKFEVKVIIMSDEVGDYKFSGDFSDAQLFELLGYLSAARVFHYKINDGVIVITK